MRRSKVQPAAKPFPEGAEQIKVPLSKLRLDPTNIRLRYLGRLRDEELEAALWKEPAVEEWYKMIKAEGGITEPLVIDSNYVTREGNERLVCLRRLSREAHGGEIPEFPEDQFDMVPCREIPPSLPERDIAIWLARVHVKGKHPWKSVNKALMIYELSTKHNFSYEEIRERLGIAKKTVQTTKSAYETTLQYHEEHRDDADWFHKYSYYYEVFKNEQLKRWARENDHLRLFGDWIYSGKLPKAEDVRKLKKLVEDPKLLAEFVGANATRARDILKTYETKGSKSLDVLAKAIEELRNFPLGELRQVISDPTRWKIIDVLHEELERFIRTAESLKKI